MAREWVPIDVTDGYYNVNLRNIRYIKVDKTNMRIDFFFNDDQCLAVGVEDTGARILLSKDKFKELQREIPIGY